MGDPSRGYWFACVTPSLSKHATIVPGGVDPSEVAVESLSELGPYANRVASGNKIPVSEFNTNNANAYTSEFQKTPKPIHPYEFKKLVDQGLEADRVRGPITTSGQRETPSRVFGFSTPGHATAGVAGQKDASARIFSRGGGHSFVMDDGDEQGKNQLVRIKTIGGHQILLHDNDGSIYISNLTGHSWLELTANGQIHLYGGGGINLRTKGSLNFHADQNIIMNAGGSFLVSAQKSTAMEAGSIQINGKSGLSLFGMQASLTGGATVSVKGNGMCSIGASGLVKMSAGMVMINGASPSIPGLPPKDLPRRNLPDSVFASPGWNIQEGALSTIVGVAPTHEPFKRSHPNTSNASVTLSNVTVDADGNTVSSSTVSPGTPVGPEEAVGQGVNRAAPTSSLINQPDPQGGLGNLDSTGMKAYMAQTGYSESGGDYTVTNQLGYLGKYQMGAGALIDAGYVKPGTSQAGLSDPNNWTGKDGMSSSGDFLGNPAVQEQTMYNYTKSNYNSLVSKGIITSDTSAADTGAGGAANWYATGSGNDANGTTGTDYFNRGRYSQVVLAANASTTVA
jgi:hypothetical protein